jgi:secreted trypsin-like serine protease
MASGTLVTTSEIRELSVQSRIVGGTAAGSGEFKFFASWDIGCGGSLIAPNMILTAAHCVDDQSDGSVRIGSNLYSYRGITRRVTQQCRHPKYDSSLDIYDYMLLTLDSPVDTTKFPVIKLNNDKSLPKTDAMLTVIGFGATTEGGSQSNTLLKVDVPANSHQPCSNSTVGLWRKCIFVLVSPLEERIPVRVIRAARSLK